MTAIRRSRVFTAALRAGIAALAPEFGFTAQFDGGEGIPVAVRTGAEDKIGVRYQDGKAEIVYGKIHAVSIFYGDIGQNIAVIGCDRHFDSIIGFC